MDFRLEAWCSRGQSGVEEGALPQPKGGVHRGGLSAALWAIELVAIQLLGPLGGVKGVGHVVGEMRDEISDSVYTVFSIQYLYAS